MDDSVPAHRGSRVPQVPLHLYFNASSSIELSVSETSRSSDVEKSLPTPTAYTYDASKEELVRKTHWEAGLLARGFPPWTPLNLSQESDGQLPGDTMPSSKSIRNWVEEYCLSTKALKEFVFTKVSISTAVNRMCIVLMSSRARVSLRLSTDGSWGL